MADTDAVNQMICSEHHRPIEALCRTHNTDLCSYCIAASHVICNVDNWARDMNNEMQNISKQLYKASTTKEKMDSILKNWNQNKQVVYEELKTKILHILSLLEKQLLENLDSACSEQFSVVEKRHLKCTEDVSNVELQFQCLNDLRNAAYVDIKQGIEQAKKARRKLQLTLLEAEGCGSLDGIKSNVLDKVKKLSRNPLHKFKESIFLPEENLAEVKDLASTLIPTPVDDGASSDKTSSEKDDLNVQGDSLSSSLLSSFELISLNESSLPTAQETTQRTPRQPNALNLVAGFDAQRANDEMKCWLTGASFLHDDRIVLVDRNNVKLKLFSKELKFLDSVPLEGKPFDVAEVEQGSIAVSLPDLQKIKFYEVGEIFVTHKALAEIDTKQKCFGLAHYDDRLFVICETSFGKAGCIKVYNSNGDIMNQIMDLGDEIGFIGSLKIAISPETHQMYYRELSWTTWYMCCTTTDKQFPWGSKSSLFQGCPVGLAAAKDGVFVSNIQNNSIQWVDACTGKVSDLKQLRTDFFFPFALSLNSNCTRLLATNSHLVFNCDDNNIVRVFEITRDA